MTGRLATMLFSKPLIFTVTRWLSSVLMENLLICCQLEKRNMILMLWQPEKSWRQLETGCGGFQGYFFPDNNSKSELLSFSKRTKKKEEQALHTHYGGKQMMSDSEEWEMCTPPWFQSLQDIVNTLKMFREITASIIASSLFEALHALNGIWKYTHQYRVLVDFQRQLSHWVQITHPVHRSGCQSWIPPVLLLPPLSGLFLQALGFCCPPLFPLLA